MAISPEARASGVISDGVMRVMPGFEGGGRTADEDPIIVSSSELAFSTTSVANQDRFVLPCDCTLVGVVFNITSAATASGTYKFWLGKVGTASHIGEYSISTPTVAGAVKVSSLTGFANTSLSLGDVVDFHLPATSVSTGKVAISMVLVPRGS